MSTKLFSFKPHFRVQRIDDERVALVSENGTSMLKGKVYSVVAPLINGRNSVDDIADKLRYSVPMEQVYYAVGLLEKKGYLSEGIASLPENEAAFWSALAINPLAVKQKLGNVSVNVLSIGGASTDSMICALSKAGVAVKRNSDFHVVVVDDYLNPCLLELNRDFVANRTAWFIIKPSGIKPWLGPLFEPPSTCCWECMAHRLSENRFAHLQFREEDFENMGLAVPPQCSLPVSSDVAISLAILEIGRWIMTGKSDALSNQLVTIDLQGFEIQKHSVMMRGQCVACGMRQNLTSPIKLESREKFAHAENGSRVCSAEETVTRLMKHVSPITGIIPRIQKWTQDASSPLHVYTSKHRNGNIITPHANRVIGRFGFAGGKGSTDIQAKASCLAESLERHSCGFQGTEERVKSSFADLHGAAVHPNDVLNFSEMQYANRTKTNKGKDLFNWIPHRFNPSREIEWTPSWSITNNEIRYLPTAFCFFDYPQMESEAFCKADSNGCATGNTMEEAILQGLLELVERDSAAIWWYNMLSLPEVDVDSFDEPYFKMIQRHLRQMGRCLRVMDISTNLAIPSFCAISWKGEGSQILFGFGSHLEVRIGITRAITELVQMLPFLDCVNHENDANQGWYESATRHWLLNQTLETQSYLIPDEGSIRRLSDYTTLHNSDILDDINYCVAQLTASGIETLVLDVSRPDVLLNCVRVTAPGLRHFWTRFAPGRLYDVPVLQGWLTKPKNETELNPIAYFL